MVPCCVNNKVSGSCLSAFTPTSSPAHRSVQNRQIAIPEFPDEPKTWYRSWITVPASLAIAMVAVHWTVARIG